MQHNMHAHLIYDYCKHLITIFYSILFYSGSSSRYFSSKETTDLFKLGPPGKSAVMEKLWELVGSEFKTFDDTNGDLPCKTIQLC